MHYKKGGSLSEIPGMLEDLKEIAQVPGGIEMLISVAAQEQQDQGGDVRQLRMYNLGGSVEYDEGGDVEGDEIMVSLSPEEYEAIVAMWGEPDINQKTGLPEYGFLSKVWKKVKGAVKKVIKSPLFSFIAPVALNFFAPGAGAALGSALGFGSKAATVGNTLLRAGVGALSGGKEGALAGAVSGLTMGGTGKALGEKLGLQGTAAKLAGDALIGGAGSKVAGGDFASGALGQAMTSMIQPGLEAQVEKGLGTVFPGKGGEFDVTPTTEGMSPIPGGAELSPVPSKGLTVFGDPNQPGILSKVGSWVKENPLLAATAAGTLLGGTGSQQSGGPPQLPPEFYESLPEYSFARTARLPESSEAYYTYGQTGGAQPGEFQFFGGNQLPSPGLVQTDLPPGTEGIMGLDIPETGGGVVTNLLRQLQNQARQQGAVPGTPGVAGISTGMSLPPAGGGAMTNLLRRLSAQAGATFEGGGYARGSGSGRDDTIEALLSDGEYVMDAETVAMLGDGSNEAGARRLDELRERLRRHKGKALAKGKFSPDAKEPLQYLKKGGKVTKRTIEEIAKDVMDKHVKTDPPKGHGVKKGLAKGGAVVKLAKLRRLARKMDEMLFEEVPDEEIKKLQAEMNKIQKGSVRKALEAVNSGEDAESAFRQKKARGGLLRERAKDRALVNAMAEEALGD